MAVGIMNTESHSCPPQLSFRLNRCIYVHCELLLVIDDETTDCGRIHQLMIAIRGRTKNGDRETSSRTYEVWLQPRKRLPRSRPDGN